MFVKVFWLTQACIYFLSCIYKLLNGYVSVTSLAIEVTRFRRRVFHATSVLALYLFTVVVHQHNYSLERIIAEVQNVLSDAAS